MTHKLPSFPIKGISDKSDVQPRQDLAAWSSSINVESKVQVSLFLRALDKLQKRDPVNDQLSYFRLAGIHGAPSQAWDHAPDPEQDFKGTSGYCHHNDYLFPTWHRPYMLLYEQCLHHIMIHEVIPEITDARAKKHWTEAANCWRLPYWDWAIKQPDTNEYGLPKILSDEVFEILELGSRTKTDPNFGDNPMFKFVNRVRNQQDKLVPTPMGDPVMGKYAITFEGTKLGDIPVKFGEAAGTSRYADSTDKQQWVPGYDLNEKVGEAIVKHQWMGEDPSTTTIQAVVSRLLSDSYFQEYEPFASTRYSQTHPAEHVKNVLPTEHLSLEMVHNNIHEWSGGSQRDDAGVPTQGHMANVPVSSFDPVFWMHHCNVDRLLAIWQYLNPDKWLNEADGLSKNLEPFSTDHHRTPWNSVLARPWEQYGYSYPELVGNPKREDLIQAIQAKYGAPVKQLRPAQGKHSLPGISHETFQDYIINLIYDRNALDGYPYKISFALLVDERTHLPVGEVYNFSTPLDSDCGNCQTQKKEGVLSKAQVPITLHLHEAVRRHSGVIRAVNYTPDDEPGLRPEYMQHFLEGALIWTVTTNGGQVIELDDFPGLEVTVLTAEAQFSETHAARYQPNKYEILHRATHGKPRGRRHPHHREL
ncbi:tyrosinase [Aspergillus brunneoviolaceus CBS 621.78]|uniref:Di-copper centre-containing protein n=1 Tax=Aspergillus brunneoviolaceus CBS 621.78 TaxID=1450534 RepID=A0ACD1G6D5_9EURO|nr:Di-copper centre-containing protein [Aspergillus brunneoviolaceus CBS 621.78]RAH44846.1 Di-copper centre-containing protein [Aspergillus brunneoviolaceus CBS 621.78]